MSATVAKKSARWIQKRVFECTKCGAKVQATKTRHKTSVGHVKTMYCYKCKEITDHIQIE